MSDQVRYWHPQEHGAVDVPEDGTDRPYVARIKGHQFILSAEHAATMDRLIAERKSRAKRLDPHSAKPKEAPAAPGGDAKSGDTKKIAKGKASGKKKK